jgi:DNA processing protein
MSEQSRVLLPDEFPALLREIPDPPRTLFAVGTLPPQAHKNLAIVGSRNMSRYGKEVIEYLVSGLTGYPISIISGLALGVDGEAHRAALRAHLHTLAVPGSGLHESVLYPSSHRSLAREILSAGGGLLSEHPATHRARAYDFLSRNRIMAGMAHATLIIEASERSGTLVTARLAVDYNRDLLCVPHSLFSENGKGPHQFIRLGANLVRNSADILEVLGFENEKPTQKVTEESTSDERRILALLHEPLDRDTLIRALNIPPEEALQTLLSLELSGKIVEMDGTYRVR